MNKLLTKIVGAALGLTMAIGVGVAVASSGQDAVPVHASGDDVEVATGSSQSVSSSPVTITFNVGSQYTGYTYSDWRLYNGDGLTIEVSDGYTFKAVSFSISKNASNFGSDFGGVGTADTSNKTWSNTTGVSTLTYNHASSRMDVHSITVTCESSSGSSKEIVNKTIVGPNSVDMVVGEADVDIADDVKVDSVKLDYDSGNGYTVTSAAPSVVSVSGTTLHAEAKGSAKITISKSDVETETTITKYASAQFTVSVTNPPIVVPSLPDGDYEKITNTNDVVEGFYLILATNNSTNYVFDGSLANLDNSSGNYTTATVDNNTITATSSLNASAVWFKAVSGGFNIIANIEEENPKYIGRTANSNGLDSSADTSYLNTVSISNGFATITSGSTTMRCNTGNNNRFRYFTGTTGVQVQLFKKASSEVVPDVYTTSISVSPKTITIPKGDHSQLSATLDQGTTVTTITWSPDANNNGVGVDSDGIVTVDANAVVDSTATITATVATSSSTTTSDTAVVTVGAPKLTGLSRNGYNAYYIGQKISDYEGGAITASWTAGDSTVISLDDSHLSITLGGVAITKDTVLTAEDDQKQIQFTYLDPNYDGVSKFTSNYKISVGKYFEIDDMVAHFDGDNDYILSTSDSGENYLSFSYVSWGGKATINSVTSSKEALLVASLSTHTFSNRAGSGTIGLLTDGESKGQAIVTLTATVNDVTLQKSFVVTVRNSAPSVTPGTTTYTKITSLADLTTGEYVITAYADSKYYAMSNTFSKSIAGTEVSVSNDVITAADVSSYTVTLTRSGNTVSIYNGSTYLNITDSKTDLSTSASAVYHSVAYSDSVFEITNTRYLAYRTSTYNTFKQYASIDGTEYYGLTLFKGVESGGTADDTTIVQNFITAYMQPNIDPSNKSDTGACRGENGYYAVAKSHLSSDLNNAQRLIFRDDFDAYYQRMIDWGVACSENFAIDNTGAIVTSARNSRAISFVSNNVNVPVIIALVSVISLSTVGAFFLLRRRKER